MAERKEIGSVSVITDTETNQEQMGDIDGGFSETELLTHIRAYGYHGLCAKLTAMQWQVWDAVRQINAERDKDTPVWAGSGA